MSNEVIEGFRLSPPQEHLWLLQQAGELQPYRAQCAVRIEGALDAEHLEAAIRHVVQRQEILRTTFHSLPGIARPLQMVTENLPGAIVLEDLGRLDEDEQARRIEELYRECSLKLFDLKQSPLLHVSLARLGANEHVLFLALPALCADAVALDNLVREIAQAYEGGARAAEAVDEPMQYLVFAEWQNELLASEEAEVGREFWRSQEVPAQNAARLPFERVADGAREFTPHALRAVVPSQLFDRIQTLAVSYRTNTEVFLLACWRVLLARLSDQADLMVAAGCDGRSDEELSKAVGLFTRYLPLRGSLKESVPFDEVLTATDEAMRAAYEWQECFSWDLYEDIIERTGEPPFFPFTFDYAAPSPSPTHRAGAVSFSITRLDSCTDRFKLRLSCVPEGDTLLTEFHYDASAFEASDIEHLSGLYAELLKSAVARSQALIGELEILSEAERHQVLFEFNDTRVDYPEEKLLHKLFEAQAARTPAHAAVEFEGERVTYKQLNDRANRVAHYLRRQGVGPETRVGLLMERSVEMVVGLLGVLKAGGAYVPLDPSYPKERISLILDDARPAALLTQRRLAASLQDQQLPVLSLDGDGTVIAGESDENPEGGATPDNLAYVIYTSGSTGRPKGVMISHRSIANRLLWMQATYPLTPDDRLLQKTVFNFDASVWEFFVPLMSGATLVMARPGGHQDSAYLEQTIAKQRITTLQVVPSMLEVLLDEAGFAECESLRRVFCGGEALTLRAQERFYQTLGSARLHNLYGPTEVSIDATAWDCRPGGEHHLVPIGKPLSNVKVYLLNDSQQPVPKGLAGELHVGGVGLARGYLNLAELTAEKFIPDPFSEEPGARLYRTGDLARHLPDGALEFLGRRDHQVKLRGFRIELAEIETTLEEHPLVKRAVVTVQEGGAAIQGLVAYIVATEGDEVSIGAVRDFLEERLPEYMVPAAYMLLDALPLTPNGKVDRRALPIVEVAQLGADGDFVVPRTPVEELIAGMWAEILGLPQVGVHDNFFELGGHSLLAVRLNSRLRAAFHVEVPLNLIFESPTVAELSETLRRLIKAGHDSEEVPIQPVSRDKKLPLSFAQQRLWFLHQLEPDNPVYNIPIAVRLRGVLDVDALERALGEILRRHEIMRTSYAAVDGQPVQIVRPAEPLPLPVTDLNSLSETDRWQRLEQLAGEEARRPFDLTNGLPVRAGLLRLDEMDHVLFFTMHHISSDAWSLGIVVREFAALYEAFASGKSSPLAELPIQYADFAVWQRQTLQGPTLDAQVDYWKQQLAGCSQVLELPTDRPRPPRQNFRGAKESFAIPPALFNELGALSRREDVTLFMSLLAAFQVLLNYHTKQDDLSIGSNIAGRNRLETEGLVGFFINLLVMHTRISGDPTFRELLAGARATALGAYAHQDVPFDRLVEELQPRRDPSRTPLVQVVFDFVSNPLPAPQLPGISLQTLPLGEHYGKFDLVLNIAVKEQELEGALQYDTDLFDSSTIIRMLHHFELILRAVVENPNLKLSAIKETLAAADAERQSTERAGFREMRRRMLRDARQFR
jgi:amino acid adenylation domain-containing protein